MNYKVRAIVGLCLILFSLKAFAITIIIDGGGTVSPDLTGKNLIANRTYTLTAKPQAGHRFEYWTITDDYGSYYEYDSPKLSFILLNGLLYVKNGTNYDFAAPFDSHITANMGPKAIIPGPYIGINMETTPIYTSLKVSANGAFSGKTFFEGEWHRFSGKFSEYGFAHTTIRIGHEKVGMTLDLYSYLGADGVVYGHSESNPDDLDSPLNWLTATLVSPRDKPWVTTYQGGKYTVTFVGEDNDASVPRGDGFATVNINRTGRLLAVGKLADGTPFTQSVLLPKLYDFGFTWPVFMASKGGSETLAGTATFNSSSAPEGYVTWEKRPATNDLSYPSGFRSELALIGSPYIRPKIRGQILDNPNLLISVDGGTLPIHFSATATLTSDNQIVANDPTNQIAISIQTDTGLFSGTAIPPGQSQPIEFQGALVQSMPPDSLLYDYYGSGFFLQDNQSGRIEIVAPPPPLETTIMGNPTNLYAGYSGGFTGVVSGTPTAYFWDFGDGTIISNSASALHTWMQGGDFQVRLRAFDDANQAGVTATCLVHVTVPSLQVSLYETEVTLARREAHQFSGQITGIVDWYLWDFGDGYTVAGSPPSDLHSPVIQHSWFSAGDFNVVLRGFNAYATGGVSATSLVHVVDAPVSSRTK
jgi:PKD repeat protein